MKTLRAALILSVALASSALADTQYTATMTGLVCATCKAKVKGAFTKLDATDIKIAAGAKEGESKITFASKKDALTKEDAVKALGDDAREFTIVTFAKAK